MTLYRVIGCGVEGGGVGGDSEQRTNQAKTWGLTRLHPVTLMSAVHKLAKKKITGRGREQLLFGRLSCLSFVVITRLTFFSISASSISRFNFLVFCFNFIILYERLRRRRWRPAYT